MSHLDEPSRTTVAGPLRDGRSWRRETAFGSVRARWLVGRVLLTLFAVGLAAYFLFLMWRPFQHARPRLILLGEPVTSEAVPDHVTVALPFEGFPRRDFDAFETLAGVTGRDTEDRPPRLSAPGPDGSLAALRRELGGVDGPGSVALVYVTARGVSIDGRPRLLWDRTADGRPTRTDLRDLIAAVTASPARTKVLLLDAGNVRTLPGEGMLVNEFAGMLGGEVERTGDRSLWVLVSHSMLEVSHVSYAERQSVFGRFVVEGLAGRADANGDRAVDLAELYEYTARSVGRWVGEQTLGRESQTPQLYRGGGAIDGAEPPVLVPVVAVTGKAAAGEATSEIVPSEKEGPTEEDAGGTVARPPGQGTGDTGATAGNAALDNGPDARSVATEGSADEPVSPSATVPRSASEATAAGGVPANEARGAADPEDTSVPATAETDGLAVASKGDPTSDATNPVGRATVDASPMPSVPTTMQRKAGARVERLVAVLSPVELQLHATWELRDRLWDGDGSEKSTGAVAFPGEWRELERTLLAYAGRVRRGQDAPVAIEAALGRLRAEFRRLDAEARAFVPVRESWSLGMLERWGAAGDSRRAWIVAFDDALEQPTDEALRGLLGSLPATAFALRELRLARRGLASGSPWSRVRRALRVRRRAEGVVAGCGWTADWTTSRVLSAMEPLRAAERALLDAVDPERDGPAVDRLLRDSQREWDEVERRIGILRRARRTRDDVALRLGNDVAWAFDTHEVGRTSAVVLVGFEEVVGKFGELAILLETPDATNVEEIARTSLRLRELRRRFVLPMQPEFVVALVESHATAVPRSFLEALLANPACRADVRLLALDALRREDHAVEGYAHGRSLAWTARLQPMFVGERWQRYVDLAENEVAVSDLAARVAGSSMHGMDEARVQLAALRRSAETLDMDAETCEETCRAFRTLGRELVGARRAVSTELPNRAPFGSTTGRSAEAAASPSPETRALVDVLGLQVKSWEAAMTGADADEVKWLLAAGDAATTIAARSTGGARDAGPIVRAPSAPPLRLDGPAVVSPMSGGEAFTLPLQLEWRGGEATPVWIVVETDGETTLHDGTAFEVYSPASLGIASVDPERLREVARERLPTLELRNGSPASVTLNLFRDLGTGRRESCVVHAISPREAVRLRVELTSEGALPIRVQCEGIERSFDDERSGLVLHPFPNRATDYRLSAASADGVGRTVVAELYAPHVAVPVPPRATLSTNGFRAFLDRLGAPAAFASQPKLVLPSDRSAIDIEWVAVTGPAASGPAPAASDAAASDAAGADGIDGENASGPPAASTRCGTSLLLVLRDAAAGTVDVRPVRLAPQQPRRYLRPHVEYDAETRRVKVTVDAIDPASAPRGAIVLRSRFEPPLPRGTSHRAAARLVAGGPGGELSARLPAELSTPLSMFVEADGWPRAFVYRIDPTRSDRDVPEVGDRLAVSVVAPPTRATFAGTVRSIPVRIEADLPRIAGSETGRGIVVGLDLNGDRLLTGEPTLAFDEDRAVEPFTSVSSDGRLSLFTTVADHEFSLPVPVGLDAVVDVLARVEAGSRTAWSAGRPVVLDGRPPRIESFGLAEGSSIVLGPPIAGVVAVTDDGLSGVASVEAAFDVDGSGEFPKGGPTFPGARGEAGTWRITIPTESLAEGGHVLVVRAVDAVGNVSAIRELPVTAFSRAAVEERLANTTRTVRGRVTYLGEPVAGADVVLEAVGTDGTAEAEGSVAVADSAPAAGVAGAKVPPKTVTDARGQFEFGKVKPGTYRVTGRATVRDRNRQRAETLVVPTVPVAVPPVELALPYKRLP